VGAIEGVVCLFGTLFVVYNMAEYWFEETVGLNTHVIILHASSFEMGNCSHEDLEETQM